MKRQTRLKLRQLLFREILIIAGILLVMNACKGPTGDQGPQGPQGSQGEQGQVGPAGNDGSMIYAGQGAPTEDIGNSGDYYLNKDNGNLYGPKATDGWEAPITLKGNDGTDGQDGTDGADGQDGQDGSVIHTGTGAPSGSLGVIGDFYFNKSTGDFYGPKTKNGWGSPTNLKGADGQDGADGKDGKDGKDGSQILKGTDSPPDNSEGSVGDYYLNTSTFMLYGPKTSNGWGNGYNLKTRVFWYIYNDANNQLDFSQNSAFDAELSDVSTKLDATSNIYLVYLEYSNGYIFHMPGYGFRSNTSYRVSHGMEGEYIHVITSVADGPGEEYNFMYIMRIPSNALGGLAKTASGVSKPVLPPNVDASDYHAVARYFGVE